MNFQIVPVAKFENQLLGERPQRFAYSYIKKKNDFKSERHFFCRYSSLHGKGNQEIRCNNDSCLTLSLDKQFKFSVEKSTHHFLLPRYTVENHFFVYKFIQTKAHFHKKRRQRKSRIIKTNPVEVFFSLSLGVFYTAGK